MVIWRTALACAGKTAIVLGGCAHLEPVPAWGDGAVAIRAAFGGDRRLAEVPEGTRRIEVRVTGDGVPADAVLAATLSPSRSSVTFAGVPAGPKLIVARAYDGGGQLLAAGQVEVSIVAGGRVAAQLRLEAAGAGTRLGVVFE